jgi:hypothetical protein
VLEHWCCQFCATKGKKKCGCTACTRGNGKYNGELYKQVLVAAFREGQDANAHFESWAAARARLEAEHAGQPAVGSLAERPAEGTGSGTVVPLHASEAEREAPLRLARVREELLAEAVPLP